MTNDRELALRLRSIGEDETPHHPSSTKVALNQAADAIERLTARAEKADAERDEARYHLFISVALSGKRKGDSAPVDAARAFLTRMENGND